MNPPGDRRPVEVIPDALNGERLDRTVALLGASAGTGQPRLSTMEPSTLTVRPAPTAPTGSEPVRNS